MQAEQDTRYYVEVSPGELLDKISILRIKTERISDKDKLRNIEYELKLLTAVREKITFTSQLEKLEQALKAVNEKLWDIEDSIRELEAAGNFGPEFIKLARAVYINNDQRASIKKQLNTILKSRVVEEKSYSDYGSSG